MKLNKYRALVLLFAHVQGIAFLLSNNPTGFDDDWSLVLLYANGVDLDDLQLLFFLFVIVQNFKMHAFELQEKYSFRSFTRIEKKNEQHNID
jgi:hypothetical protein